VSKRIGLFALVLALSACGHNDRSTDEATAASGAMASAEVVSAPSQIPTPTPTETDVNGNGKPDSDPADTDWPGKMTVVYAEATTPDAARGRKLMEDGNLLPQMADDINAMLKLPYDIAVSGTQCGQDNDFWDPGKRTVTLCYEAAAHALDVFAKLGDSDPGKSARNLQFDAFYHELGHMMIDLYHLPVTGRDEDDADQVSIYMMLRPGSDGAIDPEAIQAIMDNARYTQADADPNNHFDEGAFADTHSLDKSRMYNFECWVYGAAPDQTQELLADGMLPQERADGCADEYAKLKRSWSTLLEPYL